MSYTQCHRYKGRTDIVVSDSHEIGEADIYHIIPQIKPSLQSWVRRHNTRNQCRASGISGDGGHVLGDVLNISPRTHPGESRWSWEYWGTDRKKKVSTKEQCVHRPGSGGHKVSLWHRKQSSLARMPRAREVHGNASPFHSLFHWPYFSSRGGSWECLTIPLTLLL